MARKKLLKDIPTNEDSQLVGVRMPKELYTALSSKRGPGDSVQDVIRRILSAAIGGKR